MSDFSWFSMDKIQNNSSRLFVVELNKLAENWLQYGISRDDAFIRAEKNRIVIGVDISERKHVLLTLRAEYYGNKVTVGEDETGQLASDLSPNNPETVTLNAENVSPEDCAQFVAQKFEKTFLRPIELREWEREKIKYCKWVFSDTNQEISWSATNNTPRSDLGPPDNVMVLRAYGCM